LTGSARSGRSPVAIIGDRSAENIRNTPQLISQLMCLALAKGMTIGYNKFVRSKANTSVGSEPFYGAAAAR
jgi:hypothetical protein